VAAELDDFRAGLNAGDGDAFARVRGQFMMTPGLTHLNCGSLGATPRLVIDGVAKYMRELEADPVHTLYGAMGSAMEGVRQSAATFIGADVDELAITRNTTEGMNHIATGITLKAGDEVLTTNHEHGGGLSGWQHRAERDGVKLVQVKLPDAVRDKAAILERIAAGITPQTRVCMVSHVETVTGVVMPLRDIAAITRAKDILLVVDGAQAPGMLAVDVHAMDVDAYVSSSHKWLLAPKGSGLLYIRKASQDRIRPATLRAGFHAYTAATGTRNVPHVLGHGLAVDFHNAIGRDRIEQRCRALQQRLRGHLETLPNLRMLTPADPALSCGILTFALTKHQSDAIAEQLFSEHRIVAKVVPPTLVVDPAIAAENYNAIRLSTHIFNSEAQIDQAAAALRKLTA
jgi:selenocysteine lyase/cysteine desulfurase